jgi:hypothetical protein
MAFSRPILGLAFAAALASCGNVPNDSPFRTYVERLDTVSPTAGNALAANEAIQVHIPGDGARAAIAVNCYEGKCDKTALPPPPSATQTLTSQ